MKAISLGTVVFLWGILLSSLVLSFQFPFATQFQIVYDGWQTNPGYFI